MITNYKNEVKKQTNMLLMKKSSINVCVFTSGDLAGSC